MRYLLVLLVLIGCASAPAPGEPNSCVSDAMTAGRQFTLNGKPYRVVKTFGPHENCVDSARPIAAEIREMGDPLTTAAGVSQDAANAISHSIAQEEVPDPSGLTAADTAQILKK